MTVKKYLNDACVTSVSFTKPEPMFQDIKRIALMGVVYMVFHMGIAQESDSSAVQRVRVNLKNNEVYVGSIISQDATQLKLKTVGGDITVPNDQILSVDYLQEGVSSKFRYPNPNKTRYFFGPTAIPLEKGEGYYQNVLLSSNFVNFGLSPNFSLGGGLELISLFLGEPVLFLTPKIGFKAGENLYAGTGMLVVLPTGGGDFLLPYGVITLGTAESNVSISVGIPVVEGSADSGGLISIAGFHRFSTSFAILSENYFLPSSSADTPYIGIQGIRIIGRKNAFDLGLILTDFTPLPYVSYVRKF